MNQSAMKTQRVPYSYTHSEQGSTNSVTGIGSIQFTGPDEKSPTGTLYRDKYYALHDVDC